MDINAQGPEAVSQELRSPGVDVLPLAVIAHATVVISSRKQEGCERAAELIEREIGRRCLPMACHVGGRSACDDLVEAVYEKYNRTDVLVNNTGMAPLYESLSSVVNLAGPLHQWGGNQSRW